MIITLVLNSEIISKILKKGNKALGDNMNAFINDNWEIIFQELKPAITNTLSKIVAKIIDSVFDAVPYRKLFLDKNDS